MLVQYGVAMEELLGEVKGQERQLEQKRVQLSSHSYLCEQSINELKKRKAKDTNYCID